MALPSPRGAGITPAGEFFANQLRIDLSGTHGQYIKRDATSQEWREITIGPFGHPRGTAPVCCRNRRGGVLGELWPVKCTITHSHRSARRATTGPISPAGGSFRRYD